MDDIFERVLADLKKLQLDGGLEDDEAALVAESMDALSTVWEKTMDRRIESRVGKTGYRALLEQEGLVPNPQSMLRRALGGSPVEAEEIN